MMKSLKLVCHFVGIRGFFLQGFNKKNSPGRYKVP